MNEREQQFADAFKARTGFSLAYEAASFRMIVEGVEFKYRPDFYCRENLTFYEVAGSRQAYHEDKFKIKAFLEMFPHLKLEIVNPDGSPYFALEDRYRNGREIPNTAYVPARQGLRTGAVSRLRTFLQAETAMPGDIAEAIGMSPENLYRISRGVTRRVHVKTAEKIDAYLRQIEHKSSNPTPLTQGA